MGCDIHQINIMIDAKTKKAYDVSGEVPIGENYHSDYVEEFIDGRSYDLFGILAGVRSKMFQIAEGAHLGVPDELPDSLKEKMDDHNYGFHSFTWYYLDDLKHELVWTVEKLNLYIQARAIIDPSFISDGEIDEYRWIKHSVEKWVKELTVVFEGMNAAGHGEDFKTSKVFFFFDS